MCPFGTYILDSSVSNAKLDHLVKVAANSIVTVYFPLGNW
jgi:hypothetical protein